MTQIQHAEITTFLTQKCQLIETEFIEEMTDHFFISIEERMAESDSFEQALALTAKDFGGRESIQKMEWTYRIAFLKNQLRHWLGLVGSQFSKAKLLRTITIGTLVFAVSIYLGLTNLIGEKERQISWFTLECASVVPIVMLTWFFIQRAVPAVKKVGVIRLADLFRSMLSFLLAMSALVLSLATGAMDISVLCKGICYSVIWTTLAILYLGFLDYSIKTAPEVWYPAK